MAVHQAAMRHTETHVPGGETHSTATFTGLARSLMEIGKTVGNNKTHEADNSASAVLHGKRNRQRVTYNT